MRNFKNISVGLTACLAISTFVIWAYCGILHVDRMEDEGYYVFFKKAKPGFKFIFSNPYYSDPMGSERVYSSHMDENGDWLPGTSEFSDFSKYCWTRYHIGSVDQPAQREKCMQRQQKDSKADIHL